MGTEVRIKLKDIIARKGVVLKAEFNGNLEDVAKDLWSAHPEVNWIEEQMRPVTTLIMPGYKYHRTVTIVLDEVCFNCGSNTEFLKYLLQYLETMQIAYKFVKEK